MEFSADTKSLAEALDQVALPHRPDDSSESSDPFPKRRSMSVLWRTTGFRSAPVDPSSSWRRLPRIISRRYLTFPKHWLRCRLACWPG